MRGQAGAAAEWTSGLLHECFLDLAAENFAVNGTALPSLYAEFWSPRTAQPLSTRREHRPPEPMNPRPRKTGLNATFTNSS